MNNIFKTLHSIKDDNNLTTRQKYIVGESLHEKQSEINRYVLE